jgi:hypothetical protein
MLFWAGSQTASGRTSNILYGSGRRSQFEPAFLARGGFVFSEKDGDHFSIPMISRNQYLSEV